MTVVAGLDLSLTGTGIATPAGLTTIRSTPDSGTLTARRRRLTHIAADTIRTIHDAGLVIIEAPAHSRTGHHHDRSGLWWLIVADLLNRGTDVVEVAPTSLKKFATGRGNATKPDMRVELLKRAGIDVRDDNQVDAYWLRQIGLHLTADTDALPLPQTHLDALTKVTHP